MKIVPPLVVLLAVACAAPAETTRVRYLGPGPALTIAHDSPTAVGDAVDSFAVSCSTSATIIRSATYTQFAYACQNPSTTKVAVGDSAIADPTDAQNSPVFCATNCPSQEWSANARAEYCRADTGTVTIYCRALVSAGTVP